jgi:hypothetical protein
MRQIKKITWLIMLPLLLHTLVMAQTSIKGKVTGPNNQPVSNATVTIKGKAKASQTDAKGEFIIAVSKGETLVFSSVGFISKEIKVAEQTIINVKLTQDEGLLEGVVVTAMDIKKNPRELGYSVQKVDGDDIQETQRENFVNSLQGRVAGLTISPTSGAAGASSSIVL